MNVSDLGEFGLIDLLAGIINDSRDGQQTSWQKLLLGVGDDTAAWRDVGWKVPAHLSQAGWEHFTARKI
ncbi:hypothetical protein ACFLU4_09420 [Chloroflexota bacterium]